jgi:hypothetical protein
LRLKRKLVGAVPLRGNIYLVDHISRLSSSRDRPKIYLPSTVSNRSGSISSCMTDTHPALDHIVKLLFSGVDPAIVQPSCMVAVQSLGQGYEKNCDEP